MLCIVQGGQNDSKNQSKMHPCAHLGQQSKQAVDWFWPLQQFEFQPVKAEVQQQYQ